MMDDLGILIESNPEVGFVNIYEEPEWKTRVTVGHKPTIEWKLTTRFNWFQKKMIKFCFGFDVEDIKEKLWNI